jgi:multisubunit Na+/H+ antiporter MnhE subunit
MITHDTVLNAMREINPAFVCVTRHFGTPVALEALANILVVNPAVAYGEEVTMATVGEIAANAAPVAHMWRALAAAQDPSWDTRND